MYQPECPVSVDWQSPDCESQILMVPSLLPLAICFPSGLHATGQTLNLREVNTRINRHKQKMLDNNLQTYRFIFWNLVHLYFFRAHIYEQKVTFASGWSHRHSKQEYIFLSLFSLEYSYKKTHPSEWPVTGHSQTYILKSFTFLYFSGIVSQKKPRFRMAGHTGALRQEHDFVVIFHLIDKKTYSRECPLTVDSHLQKGINKN